MATQSSSRAPLLLLAIMVLLLAAACDAAWKSGNDIAVVEARRASPVAGNLAPDADADADDDDGLNADEVAGVFIEAADQQNLPDASTADADWVSQVPRPRALFDAALLAPFDGRDDRVGLTDSPADSLTPQAVPAAAPTSAPTAVPTPVPAPPPAPSAPTPPPPAAAPAPPVPPPPSTAEQRGQAALATVNFNPASVGYTVSFLPGRDGHLGLTYTAERRIEIYVRPSMSTGQIAYILGHELGHAVDHIRNSAADRERWMQARGIAVSTPWWPTGIGNDRGVPAGDFAECFASWSVGSTSQSAWGPCGGQMALMGELAAG